MAISEDISAPAFQAEIVLDDALTPLNLYELFGRTAPLQVDLGCGDGSFLAASAAANPGQDFLGVERLLGRTQTACRKIIMGELTNARVLRCDISRAVQSLLPPGSVDFFHLMFPDPWPKRRHASRRIVTKTFFAFIHQTLAPHGTLRITTDQHDYFRKIESLAATSPGFVPTVDEQRQSGSSTFEKRFRQSGTEIYRLVLRKVSPLRKPLASH
ncbi:MAG: tRNA (guanine-N7-)-methyltransferase [Verrucomicrobiota bacterium]|jgi:tRNA (guanine-N7-)-methyltransferase